MELADFWTLYLEIYCNFDTSFIFNVIQKSLEYLFLFIPVKNINRKWKDMADVELYTRWKYNSTGIEREL